MKESLISHHKPSAPIGIFDSGVGGLTIAKALRERMPNEDFIYFGDTLHLPYGEKSPEAILRYSLEITDFLISQKAKAIVIACNSASANAYEALIEKHPSLPIFNVIDPVVKYISKQQTTKIGLIGTKATINSQTYSKKIKKASPNTHLFSLATPLLAAMIEEGFAETAVSEALIKAYLNNSPIRKCDRLILGCTHYPIIQHEIARLIPDIGEVIDSPAIVAEYVKSSLSRKNLCNTSSENGSIRFYLSDLTPSFSQQATLFFGDELILDEKRFS